MTTKKSGFKFVKTKQPIVYMPPEYKCEALSEKNAKVIYHDILLTLNNNKKSSKKCNVQMLCTNIQKYYEGRHKLTTEECKKFEQILITFDIASWLINDYRTLTLGTYPQSAKNFLIGIIC